MTQNHCKRTWSGKIAWTLSLSLLTGVGARRPHACPSCLALAFLRQDGEIGWDDDVLQTEGFPVLEEFLATWLKMAARKVCGRIGNMTRVQKPAKEFYRYFWGSLEVKLPAYGQMQQQWWEQSEKRRVRRETDSGKKIQELEKAENKTLCFANDLWLSMAQ